MRKSITCLILGILSLVSCTEYDEIAMWNKNEDMGSRLSALEELCSQMNTNITSLRQIVEALQDNDYVTGVVPVVENGQTIGYTITFTKSGPVTIYHGRDGQSGSTPVIGVKQDTDGLYYWTLDGEWLLDDQNNKIVAQARDGKSAYELAVEKGYQGTLDEWLASLNGSAGNDGKSAYELAVEKGYQGTIDEWLASLKGNTGNDGKSAYELAVENGYLGQFGLRLRRHEPGIAAAKGGVRGQQARNHRAEYLPVLQEPAGDCPARRSQDHSIQRL